MCHNCITPCNRLVAKQTYALFFFPLLSLLGPIVIDLSNVMYSQTICLILLYKNLLTFNVKFMRSWRKYLLLPLQNNLSFEHFSPPLHLYSPKPLKKTLSTSFETWNSRPLKYNQFPILNLCRATRWFTKFLQQLCRPYLLMFVALFHVRR